LIGEEEGVKWLQVRQAADGREGQSRRRRSQGWGAIGIDRTHIGSSPRVVVVVVFVVLVVVVVVVVLVAVVPVGRGYNMYLSSFLLG
jgi:hypothetical protein